MLFFFGEAQKFIEGDFHGAHIILDKDRAWIMKEFKMLRNVRDEDRLPKRHRFEDGYGESFIERRMNERDRVSIQRVQGFSGLKVGKNDIVAWRRLKMKVPDILIRIDRSADNRQFQIFYNWIIGVVHF